MKEVKQAISEALKTIQWHGCAAKISGVDIKIASVSSKKYVAEVNLVFLSRVPAIYLIRHVYGGELFDEISSYNLPQTASNIAAKGFYCHTSLSEKFKEFSPDLGGARLLHPSQNIGDVALDIAKRIETHTSPILESIINPSANLATFILSSPEDFSYPLAALAILQRRKLSNKYEELLQQKLPRGFRKEQQFDYKKMIVEK